MIFDLPLPPSANRMWRKGAGGRLHKSSEYSAWIESVQWLVVAQRKREQITGRAALTIHCGKFHGGADLDNKIKPVGDMMQLAGAVLNDKQFDRIEIHKAFGVVPDGRMVVTVEAL